MSAIVFYFQMHQPLRLRRYTAFDDDGRYFDDDRNIQILHRVADRSYRPALGVLEELVNRYDGSFRFTLGVTGLCLEQLLARAPDVAQTLRRLAETGCVEFTAATYHHSLAFLYSRAEFEEQVRLHAAALRSVTGYKPTTFSHTELVFNTDLARWARQKKYRALLAEKTGNLPCHRVHHAPGGPSPAVLLRDYELSDDIGFRFGDRSWSGWPLTAEKLTEQLAMRHALGPVCNIMLDLESLGEHQPSETGVFDFLRALPRFALTRGRDNRFMTIGEAAEAFEPTAKLNVAPATSWADTPRDLSAWCGNAMQQDAAASLYEMEATVKRRGHPAQVESWRRLTAADHFYYMATPLNPNDAQVHRRFSPYPSPFDAYICFMNVLDDLRRTCGQ